MSKIKSFIMSNFLKCFNFICFGDLPTNYYIRNGMKIGKNFHRQNATKFDPSHCWLIEIGDDVTIANNVQILAHDDSPRIHLGYGKVGKVFIGNNSFIGSKTLILPNVKIGDNVIVGAGSVVSRDIPSGTIAVGVPAKVIGSTERYIQKCKDEIEKSRYYNVSYSKKRQSTQHKNEIAESCKNGFVYIEMGKVIEYGKRSNSSISKK